MFWHGTPKLIQWVYPSLIWHRSRKEKKIYLTFDDGPIPELTDFVLEILDKYRIKATFFCVGENIHKHTNIARRVLKQGHQLANHTYNHLNGWQNKSSAYVSNVVLCQNEIHKLLPDSSVKRLFRPPYGKIKYSQIRYLNPKYEIIMWDVLSGDFLPDLSPEKCLENTIRVTKPGSIVIFHDNMKAERNLVYALPRYIESCLEKGFQFELI